MPPPAAPRFSCEPTRLHLSRTGLARDWGRFYNQAVRKGVGGRDQRGSAGETCKSLLQNRSRETIH